MLSELVVLFSLLVIEAHCEQFKCEVVPFETNEFRGSCCIYPKNNFDRPRMEKINQHLQEQFNERRSQPNMEHLQRDPGRIEHNRNQGKTETRQRINPVTETISAHESNSRRVPSNDRNRPAVDRYYGTSSMNTRDYTENNYQPAGNRDFESGSEDNPNRVHGAASESRPLPAFDRNEIPKATTEERNQEKADRSIFQSKNGSNYNSINGTGEENLHGKTPHSNNTVPVIGNRNNVNVPDTCTEGFAKNNNGVCVKVFN